MTLNYEDIYSSFLGYIDDYDLASMTEEDAYEDMYEKMKKALAKPYVRQLFSSIQHNVGDQTVEIIMKNPTDDEQDADFVTDIIAKGMAVEWAEPIVKSKVNTSQVFGTKESKFYSQAQNLAELRNLLKDTRNDQRRLIGERGFIYNPYLDE